MKISICVPTYKGANRCYNLLRNLRSIRENFDFELLIQDDGSPWDHSLMLKSLCQENDAGYERSAQNLGMAATYNRLVERSANEIILLLDNDLIIPGIILQAIQFFFERNGDAGVIGFKSRKTTFLMIDELLAGGIRPKSLNLLPEPATELAGYCFAFKKEIWEKIDGFDEAYKRYFQDSDFCCHLARINIFSYRFSFPLVFHEEHYTLEGNTELKHEYYRELDLQYFIKKWTKSPHELEAELLAQREKRKIIYLEENGKTEILI